VNARIAYWPRDLRILGAIAQLVEHLLCKQGVRGSSPLSSTNIYQQWRKIADAEYCEVVPNGLRHGFARRIGVDERSLADTPVLDPQRTVRTDVERVLWDQAIPEQVTASGHVYDVNTGLPTTVVEAKARK
jgi:hypothetical protein